MSSVSRYIVAKIHIVLHKNNDIHVVLEKIQSTLWIYIWSFSIHCYLATSIIKNPVIDLLHKNINKIVINRRIYIANFAIFKFAVFCLTIYTCPKNPELSASTKLRDFLDRYCACPTISYFPLRSGVLTTACVCVCVCVCACVWVFVCVMCVCVMYVCACLCVCSRMCVCLTQMSSFSNFDIIVLDWGAYKCVCVYV